jgi:hypothetical protein
VRSLLASLCAFAALASVPAPLAAASDANVTVVIHVVLAVPELLQPAADAYCLGERRPYRLAPPPDKMLRRYERRLAAEGTVRDHYDLGTWTAGAADLADVAFEPVDHLFVTLPLSRVKPVVRPLIHQMRLDLHQQEVLAEILDVAYPSLGEVRTHIEVLLPFARANYAPIIALHRLFGDAGRGGASQYADAHGLHISSGVTTGGAARIEAALRRGGFRYTSVPETFLTDDAPPCRPT